MRSNAQTNKPSWLTNTARGRALRSHRHHTLALSVMAEHVRDLRTALSEAQAEIERLRLRADLAEVSARYARAELACINSLARQALAPGGPASRGIAGQ